VAAPSLRMSTRLPSVVARLVRVLRSAVDGSVDSFGLVVRWLVNQTVVSSATASCGHHTPSTRPHTHLAAYSLAAGEPDRAACTSRPTAPGETKDRRFQQ
jgi:hypothetical protein